MAVSMYRIQADDELFWIHRLKKGQTPEPEWAYVPAEEKYDENALKNILREWYGRHCCPACGKPFSLSGQHGTAIQMHQLITFGKGSHIKVRLVPHRCRI